MRAAADVLAGAGASVEEVSVPMHRDGLAIWNAIATEGATDLMVRGDGFGTNHKGHYSTDLVDFYGRARRARGMDYSVTVKLTALLGTYLSERLQPPLLRQGPEPRAAAGAPSTPPRSSASTCCCCRRRR